MSNSRTRPSAIFQIRLMFGLGYLFFSLSISVVAQPAVPVTLPPAAQEAVNKGVIAAKVPDYLLAIRYFEEARKIAPDAPIIYLNLGLAESKIPGRELRAIAWFGAYLAANPTAPNASAIKEQITVLYIKNQSNVSRLITSLLDTGKNLNSVAELLAQTGDFATALSTSDLIQDAELKTRALTFIATAQIEAGDLAGVKMTLAASLKTADLMPDKAYNQRWWAQMAIAETEIKSADFEGARRALASAIKSAGIEKEDSQMAYN